MGNEVGWLHGLPRAAKMPQQGYRQGAAGTPRECHGWVKRPQGWPQAIQNWVWVAIKPQETQAVAQPQ